MPKESEILTEIPLPSAALPPLPSGAPTAAQGKREEEVGIDSELATFLAVSLPLKGWRLFIK